MCYSSIINNIGFLAQPLVSELVILSEHVELIHSYKQT